MLIDAHCHIEKEYYGDDVGGVIERALAAGVVKMVAVGASRVLEGAREAIALADSYDMIYATAGIHPHEAQHATEEAFKTIESMLDHPKIVALGEVGLDYYYDNSPRDVQRAVFKRFLEMGKKSDRPIMLHIRERQAHEDCWRMVDEIGLGPKGGVVHCFSAGPEEARAYLERGFKLSIPGIVTFKKASDLRQAVIETPLEELMLETDAPYLAPVPHRGKTNEPSFLTHTAACVAQLKGVSVEEIGRVTSRTASAFYGLGEC
jgi:TatD DNase family protein